MRLLICLFAIALAAGEVRASGAENAEATSKTVIGPRNPELTDGARRLLAGDIEEGIRLTTIGLAAANGRRERQAALSNLCAGYVMLEQYDTALEFCETALAENDSNWRALSNRALIYVRTGRYAEAEQDLERGEAIAPRATSLKEVRGMLLDQVEPVAPTITIDDRREASDEGGGDGDSDANGD